MPATTRTIKRIGRTLTNFDLVGQNIFCTIIIIIITITIITGITIIIITVCTTIIIMIVIRLCTTMTIRKTILSSCNG